MPRVANVISNRRGLLGNALRYGLAGVVNTIIGLGTIVTLDSGLGVDSHLANALGFGAGLVSAYFLNRRFVFAGARRGRATLVRFAVAVALAFLLNQLVLALGLVLLPGDRLGRSAAQVAALGSYTGAMFLICHFWVYAGRRDLR